MKICLGVKNNSWKLIIALSDDESPFETSDSEYDNTASETVSEVSGDAEDKPKTNGKTNHDGIKFSNIEFYCSHFSAHCLKSILQVEQKTHFHILDT